MLLHLVRHGRAEAGVEHLDPGLDALGQRQAEAAAVALASSGAKRLLTSPLRRARETAEPIARHLGLPAEVSDGVGEVFDASMPTAERRGMLGPLLGGRWREQPPDLRAWREGVLETLRGLEGTADVAVVVSHFVAIGVIVGEATGDDRVTPCPLANASITTVELLDGVVRLRRAGSIGHLAPEDVSVRAPLPGRPDRPPARRGR